MMAAVIVVLLLLWFFGYINISGLNLPDLTLFSINGQPITLWSLLIFAVVAWAINLLPRPLQIIAGILLILWVLSVLGILSLASLGTLSLPSLLVLGIIVALVASFVL